MTLQDLKERCINSLNAEPKDASEREIGYSIAMRHIIELLGTTSQQETLYTEEQVRDAIELARETRWIPNCGNQYPYNHTCDEIIQSLKQPKKD